MTYEPFELVCPCHFGLEAVLKREIYDLGYDCTEVSDGRVIFLGDEEALVRANLFLRSAERVLLLVGRFTATTFEDFYQGIRILPLERFIPKDGKFWIAKASSIRSALFSPSDLQSVGKKAMVDRLSGIYKINRFEENGAPYPFRIFIHKDEVFVTLDTTGASLHKRGYRTQAGEAPLSETLASALLLLTPWREDRILVDPFCGSGTFPIEAAMIARHMAPGRNRAFTAMEWENLVPERFWKDAKEEAEDLILPSTEADIQGYDIDGAVLRVARENAQRAGVKENIHFQERDIKDLSHPKRYGFLITNPPYGERLSEKKELPALYHTLGERFLGLSDWSLFLLTNQTETEKWIGRKADKNRKIYNGMIETRFYQFMGKKPPKGTK
jgi:putative N6-adenine-specific DNA methylase